MFKKRLISEMPVGSIIETHCNACGRKLHYEHEEQIGLCDMCANEEVSPDE